MLWSSAVGLVLGIITAGLVLRSMGTGLMLESARANLEHETVGMGICPRSIGEGWVPSNGIQLDSVAGQNLELCGSVTGVTLEAVSAAWGHRNMPGGW